MGKAYAPAYEASISLSSRMIQVRAASVRSSSKEDERGENGLNRPIVLAVPSSILQLPLTVFPSDN